MAEATTMIEGTASIRAAVAKAGRRLRARRATHALITFAVPAAVLLALALVVERLRGLPPGGMDWAFATAAALPLAGLARGLLSPVDRRRIATRLDSASGLHDRLGTAWGITRGLRVHPPDGFAAAAVRDAARHADEADPAAAVPIGLPGTTRALALAALALAAAAWIRLPEQPGLPPLPPRQATAAVAPDDLDPHRADAKALREEASTLDDPRLKEIADKIAELVDRIERGDLDQQGAFDAIHALEASIEEDRAQKQAERKATEEAIQELAKELKAAKQTKALGKALDKGDLEAARKELDRLADLVEKGLIPKSALRRLAKMFDKSAEKLAKRFDERMRKALSKELDRLKELMRTAGLSEREKQRLSELRRQLSPPSADASQPQEGEKHESPQRAPARAKDAAKQAQAGEKQAQKPPNAGPKGARRAVNRLSRRMKEAAKQMRRGPQDQAAQKKAAEEMRKGANEIKDLHRAKRQAKAEQQAKRRLGDLKDTVRRSGQRQSKRQAGRMRDFKRRAGDKAGQRRQGKAGKPGESKSRRRGKLERARDQRAGDQAGDHADPGGRGKSKSLRSKRKDEFVKGKEGVGPTIEEVMLGAANEGFARTDYQQAFGRYRTIAEDELDRERVPAGYRSYVRRYFQLIRPRERADPPGGE